MLYEYVLLTTYDIIFLNKREKMVRYIYVYIEDISITITSRLLPFSISIPSTSRFGATLGAKFDTVNWFSEKWLNLK